MARTGVTNTGMLLLRSCKVSEPARRCIDKLVDEAAEKSSNRWNKGVSRDNEGARWVPHPRTGIYYPEGSEHVMDAVPDGAASFGQSYWQRAVNM